MREAKLPYLTELKRSCWTLGGGMRSTECHSDLLSGCVKNSNETLTFFGLLS